MSSNEKNKKDATKSKGKEKEEKKYVFMSNVEIAEICNRKFQKRSR